MNKTLCLLATLGSGLLSLGYGQPAQANKVGIINIKQSIIRTTDGKKAYENYGNRYEEAQRLLQKRQSELQALRSQLQNSRYVLKPEALGRLEREVELKDRSLTRDSQEQEIEFNQEQVRVVRDLTDKFRPVIEKYARENGFVLIFDVSSADSGVLFASDAVDVTEAVARLYEQLSTAARNSPPAPAK